MPVSGCIGAAVAEDCIVSSELPVNAVSALVSLPDKSSSCLTISPSICGINPPISPLAWSTAASTTVPIICCVPVNGCCCSGGAIESDCRLISCDFGRVEF